MFLFTFLFIPCLLVCYFLWQKNYDKIMVVVLGVLTAVFVCTIKALFFFSHRIVPFAFTPNFIHHLLLECLLPSLLFVGLFFLVTKDEMSEKLKSVFPLLAAFYLVYMPYNVIISSASSVYSMYSLFVKPLIFGAMIMQIGYSCNILANNLQNKLMIVLNSLLILGYLVCPAVLDAMYDIQILVPVRIIVTCIYVLIPVFFTIKTVLKNK